MSRTTRTVIALVLGAGLIGIGRWSAASSDAPPEQEHDHGAESSSDDKPEVWTCPMHAQIRMPEFNVCPICGMDLVQQKSGEDLGPRRMAMSPDAVKLAGIRTTLVDLRYVTRPVRMVGKLEYDETVIKRVSAWVPGRIERLYVDYTGVDVAAGEHLFELYSPDLLSAQEELLSAKERLRTTSSNSSEFLRQSSERAYQGARAKLVLLGFSEAQVDEIEQRGSGAYQMTIHSPVTGTVIEKHLDQGAYVQTGSAVYTIADLSRLWVQLDAYEQDLSWLRYGQHVTLQVEALPGETFEGTIAFIAPIVHDPHRTAKVRVNLPNLDGRLKPGMFVRAVVEARLGRDGAVMPPDLLGKWVCPMHPEVVEEEAGECEVCGMPLVPAEELPFASGDSVPQKALVVPASAVLVTGRRGVVYVQVPGTERPTYEGREVLLGPRAGDEYVVRDGLEEGERVVIQGAFRIDSSMQIQAKRSMLSMPADNPVSGSEGEPFRASLAQLYGTYLELQTALAGDDLEAGLRAAGELSAAMDQIRPALLPRRAQLIWGEERVGLNAALARVQAAEDMERLRGGFEPLSSALLALASTFGVPAEAVWYEAHCPMAFDNGGASWLQAGDVIANPYFGAAMLSCGDVRGRFVGSGADLSQEREEMPGMDHSQHREGPDGDLVKAYLAVQVALAGDRMASQEERDALTSAASGLEPLVEAVVGATDIEAQRAAFGPLSTALIERIAAGNRSGMVLHQVHCPMAFDFEGGDWLSSSKEVLNPYFGSEMLTCGSVKGSFEPGN